MKAPERARSSHGACLLHGNLVRHVSYGLFWNLKKRRIYRNSGGSRFEIRVQHRAVSANGPPKPLFGKERVDRCG